MAFNPIARTDVDIDNLILLNIEEVYGFNKTDDSLEFVFDQIKSGTIATDQSVVYAEGKQGVRLGSLKKGKTASVNFENGYVVASAYAYQLGSSITTASAGAPIRLRRAERLTIGATGGTVNATITLRHTPVESSVKYMYLCNSDGTAIQKFSKGDAPTTQFSISGSTITLPTGTEWTATDVILVTYDENIEVGKKFIDSGENFSQTVRLVLNLSAQDPCTKAIFLVQYEFDSADVNGQTSMAIGDNPAVHNFSAEALLAGCSTSKELFSVILA